MREKSRFEKYYIKYNTAKVERIFSEQKPIRS